MKIRSVGAELLDADGQTDKLTATTDLLVNFRNFTKAPENMASSWSCVINYAKFLYHSWNCIVKDFQPSFDVVSATL